MSSAFSEHTWDIEHIAKRYRRSNIDIKNPRESKGLSTEKAHEYLERNGKNELPKPPEVSMLKLFFKQFNYLLIYKRILCRYRFYKIYIISYKKSKQFFTCKKNI